MNRDNVVLEEGSLKVKGNEAIRAGCHIEVRRGTFRWIAYVPTVSHSYIPLYGYTTTLTIERGMSFVERARLGGDRAVSPYLAELAPTRSR